MRLRLEFEANSARRKRRCHGIIVSEGEQLQLNQEIRSENEREFISMEKQIRMQMSVSQVD